MIKPEWGTKRLCRDCGASFYDMRRNPIICPKCGAKFTPAPLSKSPRSRGGAQAKAASAAAEAAPQAPPPATEVKTPDPDPAAITDSDEAGAEPDESAAADGDVELEDDGDNEEDVIEDPAELGEDKDDMFEVMDNVDVEKKDET